MYLLLRNVENWKQRCWPAHVTSTKASISPDKHQRENNDLRSTECPNEKMAFTYESFPFTITNNEPSRGQKETIGLHMVSPVASRAMVVPKSFLVVQVKTCPDVGNLISSSSVETQKGI